MASQEKNKTNKKRVTFNDDPVTDQANQAEEEKQNLQEELAQSLRTGIRNAKLQNKKRKTPCDADGINALLMDEKEENEVRDYLTSNPSTQKMDLITAFDKLNEIETDYLNTLKDKINKTIYEYEYQYKHESRTSYLTELAFRELFKKQYPNHPNAQTNSVNSRRIEELKILLLEKSIYVENTEATSIYEIYEHRRNAENKSAEEKKTEAKPSLTYFSKIYTSLEPFLKTPDIQEKKLDENITTDEEEKEEERRIHSVTAKMIKRDAALEIEHRDLFLRESFVILPDEKNGLTEPTRVFPPKTDNILLEVEDLFRNGLASFRAVNTILGNAKKDIKEIDLFCCDEEFKNFCTIMDSYKIKYENAQDNPARLLILKSANKKLEEFNGVLATHLVTQGICSTFKEATKAINLIRGYQFKMTYTERHCTVLEQEVKKGEASSQIHTLHFSTPTRFSSTKDSTSSPWYRYTKQEWYKHSKTQIVGKPKKPKKTKKTTAQPELKEVPKGKWLDNFFDAHLDTLETMSPVPMTRGTPNPGNANDTTTVVFVDGTLTQSFNASRVAITEPYETAKNLKSKLTVFNHKQLMQEDRIKSLVADHFKKWPVSYGNKNQNKAMVIPYLHQTLITDNVWFAGDTQKSSSMLDNKALANAQLQTYLSKREIYVHKDDPQNVLIFPQNECKLYLMKLPEQDETFKESDKNNLYLYKKEVIDKDGSPQELLLYRLGGKLFRFTDKKNSDLKNLISSEKDAFNQAGTDIQKCVNAKICHSVLSMTSNRGHTYTEEKIEKFKNDETFSSYQRVEFDVLSVNNCLNMHEKRSRVRNNDVNDSRKLLQHASNHLEGMTKLGVDAADLETIRKFLYNPSPLRMTNHSFLTPYKSRGTKVKKALERISSTLQSAEQKDPAVARNFDLLMRSAVELKCTVHETILGAARRNISNLLLKIPVAGTLLKWVFVDTSAAVAKTITAPIGIREWLKNHTTRRKSAYKSAYEGLVAGTMGVIESGCMSNEDRGGEKAAFERAMVTQYAATGKLIGYNDSPDEKRAFLDTYANNVQDVHNAAKMTTDSSIIKSNEILNPNFSSGLMLDDRKKPSAGFDEERSKKLTRKEEQCLSNAMKDTRKGEYIPPAKTSQGGMFKQPTENPLKEPLLSKTQKASNVKVKTGMRH